MAPRSSFLKFPPEIRLMIYDEYLGSCRQGFFFNTRLGKLILIGSQSINLNLLYACRAISDELKAFAFRTKTFHFSTTHVGGPLSRRANAFRSLLQALHEREEDALKRLGPRFSSDVRIPEKIASILPGMLGVLLEKHLDYGYVYPYQSLACDMVGPQYRRTITEALRAARNHPGPAFTDDKTEPFDTLELCHDSWAIPSEKKLNETASALLSGSRLVIWRYTLENLPSCHRYSAAAVAVRFLQSLTAEDRLCLRKIKLHEDQPSTGMPEGHAQGLIPFCQENPALRIERHLDYWKLFVFPEATSSRFLSTFYDFRKWESKNLKRLTRLGSSFHKMNVDIASWILEARGLVSEGMPEESFSLFIDGGPAPGHASMLFRGSTQLAGAYQAAIEECWTRGYKAIHSFEERREFPFYIHKGFPQAMDEIVQGSSIVRCNFDMGKPWEVKPEDFVTQQSSGTNIVMYGYWPYDAFGDTGDLLELPGVRWVPRWVSNVSLHLHQKWENVSHGTYFDEVEIYDNDNPVVDENSDGT